MGMREKFEFWQCEAGDGPQTDPMWMIYDAAGNYGIAEVQLDWIAWQAYRAALVVQLPSRWSFDAMNGGWVQRDDGANLDYLATVARVESYGFGIKP